MAQQVRLALREGKQEDRREALLQSLDRVGDRPTGPAVDAAGRAGHDQAEGGRRGAAALTAYLSNGGTLEHAQQIARHASPKMTKLYDRTAATVTVDKIERIMI